MIIYFKLYSSHLNLTGTLAQLHGFQSA